MNEILLVGNPNVGKSTLFNIITKGNRHTGNWHGVTVDEESKIFKIDDQKYSLVDLPGLYSLSPNSYEEQVSVDYILSHPKSKILCLCSNLSLKRNLLLFYELAQLEREIILVINSMHKTLNFDILKLEKSLHIRVCFVNVKDKKSVQTLTNLIKNNEFFVPKITENNCENINILKNKIKINNNSQKMLNFFCHKALCQDEYYINKLKINKNEINFDKNYLENSIKEKYYYIDSILNNCNYKTSVVVGKSKLDKIVLNKFLCIPIFLCIMAIIFYITFFSVGSYLSSILRYLIQDKLGKIVVKSLQTKISTLWVIDLVEIGIFGGVGTIISFLPQVMFLFIFLSILEDSGYISRLAFMFDDTLKKVGLSGRSIYTLIMGFGCGTTACLTARNMSDKNAKIKTAMLSPFMSCSAKLPVYAVIGGAFFGASNVLIIVLLYVLGIILALLFSLFFEKTYLKSNEQTFLMEFPSYQTVNIKRVIKVAYESIKTFIIRVGSVLFSLSIIVWILENFSFDFSYCKLSGNKSILQNVGEFISPIFIPLGFSSWGAVSALLSGVVAKEIIISSIAIFNNVSVNSENFMQNVSHSLTNIYSSVCFTPASAMSFMIFCLLYTPCIATISVLKKEIGKKWTLVLVVLQLMLAYITAMVVYFLFNMFLIFSLWVVLLILICACLLCFSFFKLFSKKTKKCTVCNLCLKNCK